MIDMVLFSLPHRALYSFYVISHTPIVKLYLFCNTAKQQHTWEPVKQRQAGPKDQPSAFHGMWLVRFSLLIFILTPSGTWSLLANVLSLLICLKGTVFLISEKWVKVSRWKGLHEGNV